MQFHLRDRTLQAQEEAAVGRARIVHAIAIANEALSVAAQVQQRVPVRAVPREPGHLGGEDDTDLAEGDTGDQVPEPLAVRGRCPTQAEISVDDLDACLLPAEIAGALVQCVLQAQALLVG